MLLQTDKVGDQGMLFCSFEVPDIICVTELWSQWLTFYRPGEHLLWTKTRKVGQRQTFVSDRAEL